MDTLGKGLDIPENAIDPELAHELINGNEQKMDYGRMLDSSISQGLFSFNPDMIYDKVAKDYNTAEKLYGETFLRAISGYDPTAIKKNIKIPEFQRELKNKIKKNVEALKDEGLINKQGEITDKGLELASLVLYMEELDDLRAKGLGEKKSKKLFVYGDKENVRPYRKHDRFRDIALKKSIKQSIRKGHTTIEPEDLMVFEKDSKGKIYIIYCLDASGSMKGKKIAMCKKAGIALAYKAIDEHDKVGLMVFGSEIEESIAPTSDFSLFLKSIAKIRAKKQTDLALTIEKAIELFPKDDVTKHLILITDANPTAGNDPKRSTLNLVERAAANGITVSVIGIGLDKDGEEFSKKIVEIGQGNLHVIKDLDNLDKIVLHDYYSLV